MKTNYERRHTSAEVMTLSPKIDKLLYSIKEAQYLLCCSRTSLWAYVKAGDLVPTRLGRAVRFSPESILRFVAAREAKR